MTKPKEHESFDRAEVIQIAKKQLIDEAEQHGLNKAKQKEQEKKRQEQILAEVHMLFKGLIEENQDISLMDFRIVLIKMKEIIKDKTSFYPYDFKDGSVWKALKHNYQLKVNDQPVDIALMSRIDSDNNLRLKLDIFSEDAGVNRILEGKQIS